MIILDATSISGGGAGNQTWSHTSAGDLLEVGVLSAGGTSDVVTSVTFNGDSLTRINTVAAVNTRVYLYYRLAPAAGTHDIVVTISGGNVLGYAASHIGALQSGQPDASATSQDSTTTSNTLTTVANNCLHICMFHHEGGGSLTLGADTQAISTNANTGLFSNISSISPGSHSLTFTMSIAGQVETAGASFAPTPGMPVPQVITM